MMQAVQSSAAEEIQQLRKKLQVQGAPDRSGSLTSAPSQLRWAHMTCRGAAFCQSEAVNSQFATVSARLTSVSESRMYGASSAWDEVHNIDTGPDQANWPCCGGPASQTSMSKSVNCAACGGYQAPTTTKAATFIDSETHPHCVPVALLAAAGMDRNTSKSMPNQCCAQTAKHTLPQQRLCPKRSMWRHPGATWRTGLSAHAVHMLMRSEISG